jgi:hypothetical protein
MFFEMELQPLQSKPPPIADVWADAVDLELPQTARKKMPAQIVLTSHGMRVFMEFSLYSPGAAMIQRRTIAMEPI